MTESFGVHNIRKTLLIVLMLNSNESEDDADGGEGGGEPSVYYDRAKLPLQLSSLL